MTVLHFAYRQALDLLQVLLYEFPSTQKYIALAIVCTSNLFKVLQFRVGNQSIDLAYEFGDGVRGTDVSKHSSD